MKPEQLRCFVSAVDTGSFVAAGDQLHLSPSAVAYNVEALERHLATPLLLRRPAAGVVPTKEGKRLLDAARSLLQEMSDIEDMFSGRSNQVRGELIVGCQEGLSWSLVPRAMERINQRYPELNVMPRTVFMDEGISPIAESHVDILVTFLTKPLEDKAINVTVLCAPEPYVLMRKGHPLDNGEDNINLADVARYPQIFLQDGPALDLFRGMFEQHGLVLQQSTVTNGSTAVHAIIGTCDSVSLRVARPAHHLSPLGHQLSFVRIADEVIKPQLVILSPKTRGGGNQAKVDAFTRICLDLFDNGEMKSHFFY